MAESTGSTHPPVESIIKGKLHKLTQSGHSLSSLLSLQTLYLQFDTINNLGYSIFPYRDWWQKAQEQLIPPVESIIKGKLRKLSIHPGFPNPHVMEAYLNPSIDESQEEFSWGSPDLDLLREYPFMFLKQKLIVMQLHVGF